MPGLLSDVPIKDVERVVDGMKADYLLKKVESLVPKIIIRKVCKLRVSPMLVNRCACRGCSQLTYGHEMIDTKSIPTIIALLTLYAMR